MTTINLKDFYYAIVRRGTANRYYRCSTPRTVPDMDCFQWKIYEDDIVEMVIEARGIAL